MKTNDVFISATRLRVKSLFYLPAFFYANESSVKQLLKAEGFIGGKELVDKNFTFWTLTIWDNAIAMRSFRNSVAHRKAMQKLPKWCDEAAYVHWTQENDIMPGWLTVHEKLLSEGKITKVKKPSSNQLQKRYPVPKWTKTERNFKV